MRSIPAHAGEPGRSTSSATTSTVYPRPRGGTKVRFGDEVQVNGLSPPTRGNRETEARAVRLPGSIPAHAGEPGMRAGSGDRSEVYPRPRGGTQIPAARQLYGCGLSPPTRGNPGGFTVKTISLRSIPAHAGEPRRLQFAECPSRVYPRPRGGTTNWSREKREGIGLSPPTRGNHSMIFVRLAFLRSIPAHAGEPRRVAPRPATTRGLSPPTRGNRARRRAGGRRQRSIPAHAGEPADDKP